MARYDYTFRITSEKGETYDITYQALIKAMGIEKEIVCGRPLTDGGVPQASMMQRILEKTWNTKSVKVLFNGSQIL